VFNINRPSFAIASVMRRVLSFVVHFLLFEVAISADEEEETDMGVPHGNISDIGCVVDVSIVATMLIIGWWRLSN